MISVIPATPHRLKSCRRFGFKTKNNFKEARRTWGTMGDKLREDIIVGYLKAILGRFSKLPCEVSISISITEGEINLIGEVKAYERKCKTLSEEINECVEKLVAQFSSEHPRSSLTFTFSQAVEITKVYS